MNFIIYHHIAKGIISLDIVSDNSNYWFSLQSGKGILCSSFSVRESDVIVHKNDFSCIPLLNFWPFCTPHHWRTRWLRWEQGKITRSCWAKFQYKGFGGSKADCQCSQCNFWWASLSFTQGLQRPGYLNKFMLNSDKVNLWLDLQLGWGMICHNHMPIWLN